MTSIIHLKESPKIFFNLILFKFFKNIFRIVHIFEEFDMSMTSFSKNLIGSFRSVPIFEESDMSMTSFLKSQSKHRRQKMTQRPII